MVMWLNWDINSHNYLCYFCGQIKNYFHQLPVKTFCNTRIMSTKYKILAMLQQSLQQNLESFNSSVLGQQCVIGISITGNHIYHSAYVIFCSVNQNSQKKKRTLVLKILWGWLTVESKNVGYLIYLRLTLTRNSH